MKKSNKEKTQAVLSPKYVRKSIREDAIIYIPGEGFPAELQAEISMQVEKKADELLKQELERREKQSVNKELRSQLSHGDTVLSIMGKLSSFGNEDRIFILKKVNENLLAELNMQKSRLENGFEFHHAELKRVRAQIDELTKTGGAY